MPRKFKATAKEQDSKIQPHSSGVSSFQASLSVNRLLRPYFARYRDAFLAPGPRRRSAKERRPKDRSSSLEACPQDVGVQCKHLQHR